MVKNVEKSVLPAEIRPEDLATLLDLTEARLRNLAREGVLPKPQRGHYNLVGSVQGYIKMLRKDEKEDSLTSTRARMTSVKADVAELQRGKLTGELITVNEVRASWSQIFILIRTRMLAIPSKLALRLAQCRAPMEAKTILDGEIREALEDIAQTEIRSRAAGRNSGSDFRVAVNKAQRGYEPRPGGMPRKCAVAPSQ